jgi:2-dehydropantoate 2-reductase
MAQDLARGRPTEIEFINGAVVEEAEARGLAAPAHRSIIARLRAMSTPHRVRE